MVRLKENIQNLTTVSKKNSHFHQFRNGDILKAIKQDLSIFPENQYTKGSQILRFTKK